MPPEAPERCGIPGTATIRFTEVVKETDETFFATGTFRYRFTATETGKSITIRAAGPTRSRVIIDEAWHDHLPGHLRGLPEKISITGGPTLSRDAGTVTFTTTFALDPETGEPIGEPLSEELAFLHGPRPELWTRRLRLVHRGRGRES